MSYILDALRRADAERDRGTVPGLHSQPMPLAAEPPPPHRPVPWAWIAVGAAVGVAALVLWRWLASDAAPAPMAAVPRAAAPAATAVDAVVPPPPVTAAPSEAAALPAPTLPPVARQPQSVRSATTPPSRAAPRDDAPATQDETPTDRGVREAAPRADARTGDAMPGQPAAATVVRRENLPEEIKRNLPTLAVGGSMYSPDPAQRMLIINGQIMREGDTVAPDLTLESIRLRSAVLRFRDRRFEIAY
jgi:general secretion pathway protein B